MTTSLHEEAQRFRAGGVSVFPGKSGSKLPHGALLPRNDEGTPTWNPYKERLPTAEEITDWWTRCPDAPILTVCGKVSGNRETLDFFRNTRETLEGVYVRPRYDGYLEFQDRGGDIVNACLAGRISIDSAITELEHAYAGSLP